MRFEEFAAVIRQSGKRGEKDLRSAYEDSGARYMSAADLRDKLAQAQRQRGGDVTGRASIRGRW